MNLKKLAPWNWFNKENENDGHAVPVNTSHSIGSRYSFRHTSPNIFEEIDRLFETPINGFGRSLFGKSSNFLESISSSTLKPRLDLGATRKEYTVGIEVPGINEKDVHLEIVNNTLTISGEKNQETEEKNKNYYRCERSYCSFQRVLSLPEDADQDKIKARFKKGVLNIIIPRKPIPESKIKQVQISYA